MAIILFFSAFILLYGVISLYYKPINTLNPNLETLIFSVLIFSTFIALDTELLSLLNCIHYKGILISYIVLHIILIIVILKNKNKTILNFKQLITEIYEAFFVYEKTKLNKFYWWSCVSILVILLTLAFAYPPNNQSDTLQYHIPRVYYWVSNNNLNPFQNNYFFQLIFPPFSSFVILHLNVLNLADYYTNLSELIYAIFFIPLLYLILNLMVAKKYNKYALILMLTLPVFLFHSTSNWNELILSFFVCCFLYYGLLLQLYKKKQQVFAVSLSIALSILTKNIALYFLFVLTIFYLIILVKAFIRKEIKLSKIIQIGIYVILVLFIINVGYFFRNFTINGNIVGSTKELVDIHLITTNNFYFRIVNVLNNIFNQLIYPLNQYFYLLLEKINIDFNNNTIRIYKNIFIPKHNFNGGSVPSFFHFLLFVYYCIYSFYYCIKNKKINFNIFSFFLILFILELIFYSINVKSFYYNGRYLIFINILSVIIISLWISKYKNFNFVDNFIKFLIIPYSFFCLIVLGYDQKFRPSEKTINYILKSINLDTIQINSKYGIESSRVEKLYGNMTGYNGKRDKLEYEEMINYNIFFKPLKNKNIGIELNYTKALELNEYGFIYPSQFNNKYYAIYSPLKLYENYKNKITIPKIDYIVTVNNNKDTLMYNNYVYKNIVPKNKFFWYYERVTSDK